RKLRHSLRRPSRSDLVQFLFVFPNSYCFPDVSFHNQNCSNGSIIDMQCNKTAVTVLPDNSGL
ncbi:MAG: hypothetical protein Q4G15_12370, partial [Lachnospiraceae bacterium]|nr:hypothetical protein [Lachnospiraceae bacterium]